MSERDLQKVAESQNPDLTLTASGGEWAQTSWNTWGMRGIGGGFGGISPEQNIEATMIVSIYNRPGTDLARYCAECTQEQWQQEPADGRKGVEKGARKASLLVEDHSSGMDSVSGCSMRSRSLGIDRGSSGFAVAVFQMLLHKLKTDVFVDQPQQMVFRNLIFHTELVEPMLRNGSGAHHDQQASEN